MIADTIVADSYLLANRRRDIADGIIAGLFILFDVDSEPDDHSEVLLLFVGCIVNFSVSYLICMFQDSVPTGSYNDPFLSSVCVCAIVRIQYPSLKSTKSTNQQQNQDLTGAAILRTSVGRGEGYAPLASALRGGS